MIALEREQYPLVDIRHDSRWESIEYDPHIGEHEPTRLLPYLEPGNRVLEIGCGYGNVVARLARPDLDLRVVGVDINVRAIHTAAEKLKNLDVGHVRLFSGDVLAEEWHKQYEWRSEKVGEQSPAGKPRQVEDIGRFDAVILIRVLTCFPLKDRWDALLDRCSSLLNPGGLIYIDDFWQDPSFPAYRTRYDSGLAYAHAEGITDWREGSFLVPEAAGTGEDVDFVAHHHSGQEIRHIQARFREIDFRYKRSLSMNGNPCGMFVLMGRNRLQSA